MSRRFAILAAALVACCASPWIAKAQTKAAAAPRRDLSGIWEPTIGAQGRGAANMPADGKSEHELPYTALGLEAFSRNRPSNGPNEVPASEDNDPVHICDPQGFPRENLFELRATQIL